MTAHEISSKKKWESAHLHLNQSLEKEINLMREILASLHQEELSLLEGNFQNFEKILTERSELIIEMKGQREARMSSTELVTKIAIEQERPEILPLEEEISCDVLTKLDQLVALSERINLQNCRNDALFDQAKQKQDLPLKCLFPHPLHAKKRRKKPSVATDTQTP